MRVTISDIAKRAKVSTATVSYVINDRKDTAIAEKTKDRVLAVAREMGYFPNRIAKSLVTGRTETVALWAFQIYPGYYANVIQQLTSKLRGDEYDIHLIETADHYKPGWADRVLGASPVDGIIAFDSPTFVCEYLKHHKRTHKPIVSVGGVWCDKTDFVGVDLFSGTKQAVEHLVSLGRRRVACLAPANNRNGTARTNAYVEVMNSAGRKPEFIEVSSSGPGLARGPARTRIKEYVRSEGCPDAVFCFNDEGAIGVYRGLRDLSLRIPEDVAIVGCDGVEDTEYLDVPLSTLALPLEELCTAAWSFLQKRMNFPKIPPQQMILKPELLVRESSRGPGR